ncbi:DUF2490 domain-containing protein [Aquimarina mytili]|uniref:DUF2490 domain-containing protein n=1 Tax=Aquimarina mytili TaxID=874423 RepID=A0A937D8M9_9FLAO|nr:DUF2490 domain-containing protein [Aquimarina mytili]MBL0682872.1 DUF2490 domain-containing protein [Aquimarina mytili]
MTTLKTTIVLSLFFFVQTIIAQEDLKLWTGHSAQAKLTKEWRLTVGQLLLFSQEPFELSSLQNSASISYRISKRTRVGLGYIRSSDPFDPDQEARNRITGRYRKDFRLGKLRIANSFRAEWHFPERSKFEYRLRYGFRIHRGNWGLPLKTTPFITNEFHYYLSGRPFQYRDELGDKVIKQSPNGLHAHRITLGVRFKPFRRANASLSYMRQTEFNIGNKYRRINVVDPRNGRVKRAFSNFSVVMFRFSYQLDLREKFSKLTSIGSKASKRRRNNKMTSI